ncbi:MAG TPA: lytic transglycosylase domain-containing protein [Vicinamibacterales bacterium]|nr:lytic transglycosylase domain-containing protein [Vicinamibacterales bacterium]
MGHDTDHRHYARRTACGVVSCVSVASILCVARPARAELAYFTTGRALSIKSHRVDGETYVLALRTGGEIVTDKAVIDRFAPDEVPYPEDEPVRPAENGQADESSRRLQADPRYNAIIDKVAAAEGVSPQLVKAVIKVESAYQERARSRKGAMGLMQLMPSTARQYAVQDPYEPTSNIEAGIKYLKSLLDRYELKLALAAYNAGEGAVKRFGGIPPYPETQKYVADILKLVGR